MLSTPSKTDINPREQKQFGAVKWRVANIRMSSGKGRYVLGCTNQHNSETGAAGVQL
jgi:hypothetical protein